MNDQDIVTLPRTAYQGMQERLDEMERALSSILELSPESSVKDAQAIAARTRPTAPRTHERDFNIKKLSHIELHALNTALENLHWTLSLICKENPRSDGIDSIGGRFFVPDWWNDQRTMDFITVVHQEVKNHDPD
jgi:hypothetical protein